MNPEKVLPSPKSCFSGLLDIASLKSKPSAFLAPVGVCHLILAALWCICSSLISPVLPSQAMLGLNPTHPLNNQERLHSAPLRDTLVLCLGNSLQHLMVQGKCQIILEKNISGCRTSTLRDVWLSVPIPCFKRCQHT